MVSATVEADDAGHFANSVGVVVAIAHFGPMLHEPELKLINFPNVLPTVSHHTQLFAVSPAHALQFVFISHLPLSIFLQAVALVGAVLGHIVVFTH